MRAIVEAHLTRIADEYVTELHTASRSVDSSWEDVRRFAQKQLDFDLGSDPTYSLFMGYVDIRNSAMHGNGVLTPPQKRKLPAVTARLRAIGCYIDNDQLIIADSVVRNCALTCRRLVISVDQNTWKPSSGLRGLRTWV
jgi:hypothetical protein